MKLLFLGLRKIGEEFYIDQEARTKKSNLICIMNHSWNQQKITLEALAHI